MDEINKIWPKYHTEDLIGSGSFGKVYRVCREELGEKTYAAVKVIHIPQDQSEINELRTSGMDYNSIRSFYQENVKNLMNEIRLMDSLKSGGNTVSIEDYEVREKEDGIGWDIYIRMELLKNCSDYIAEHDNKMSERMVVKLGMDICKALQNCEQKNIIHRDIKLDNVFISPFGDFKLGDFGISKQLEKTKSAMSQKGTSMYMAPEVYKGEKYDKTVDIYSLGILLYRLLNYGRFPFLPSYPEVIMPNNLEEAMMKRMSGETLVNPDDASLSVAKVVLKACAYQAKDRYQSAAEMLADLERCVSSEETKQVVEEDTIGGQAETVVYEEVNDTDMTEYEKTVSVFGFRTEETNQPDVPSVVCESNNIDGNNHNKVCHVEEIVPHQVENIEVLEKEPLSDDKTQQKDSIDSTEDEYDELVHDEYEFEIDEEPVYIASSSNSKRNEADKKNPVVAVGVLTIGIFIIIMFIGLVSIQSNESSLSNKVEEQALISDADILKKIIDEQQNAGAIVSANMESNQYVWDEEGRLIEIKWINQKLSGYISFKGLDNLQYLRCSDNRLSELDVSNNPALEHLECNNNQLSELNVSNNLALKHLECNNSNSFSSQIYLNGSGRNQLSKLDVSNNPVLESLECGGNQLSELDVSNNLALKHLECRNNQLSELKVSNDSTLKYLVCGDNQLSELDVSNNPALESLRCSNNQLSELNVNNNPALEYLECNNNQLSELNVSNNPALEGLYCSNNQLSELNVSNDSTLKYLVCDDNQLSELDVSNNPALERLECNNNQLSELNVNNNPALERLECNNNQLSELNVSDNPALWCLRCEGNQISELDVSNNPSLIWYCDDSVNVIGRNK